MQYIALILLAIAIFLIFKVSVNDFLSLFEHSRKSKDFKELSSEKENPIVKFITDTKNMLEATGQIGRFNLLIIITIVLALAGAIGAIYIKNLYLIPVFAIGAAAVPFIFVRFQFIAYNKLVTEELASAMSAVTISYVRTENILSAFKENVENIREPIRSVFLSFINEMENVNPNYEQALDNMKNRIDNSVWVEWCEALKRCSRNKGLMYVLAPIVTKLTKISIVTNKLQNILMECVKDFWVMLFAALALLYAGVYILPSSLMMDISDNISNALVAINIAVAIIVAIRATLITSEIKFDV